MPIAATPKPLPRAAFTQADSDIFFIYPRAPSNYLSAKLSTKLLSAPWKGREAFSGPRGLRHHRRSVAPEHHFIGNGQPSKEMTLDADYLWRPAPNTPFARPRSCQAGEIGWGIPFLSDWTSTITGHQITMAEFRQQCEDYYTHRFQSAGTPLEKPQEDDDAAGLEENKDFQFVLEEADVVKMPLYGHLQEFGPQTNQPDKISLTSFANQPETAARLNMRSRSEEPLSDPQRLLQRPNQPRLSY